MVSMDAGLGRKRWLRLECLLALVAAACSSTGEREQPPLLVVDVNHFAGPVLTGPTAEEPDPAATDDAWGLALRLAVLDELPEGDPLAPRLVIVEGATEAFVARAELALGIRLVPAGEPESPRWQARRLEALVPGATTTLTLAPDPLLRDAPRPAWGLCELEVSRRQRDPSRVEVVLGFTGTLTPRADDEEQPGGEPTSGSRAPVRVRERIVLDGAPERGGDPWRIALPAPSANRPRAAILIEVGLPALLEGERETSELAAATARANENVALARRAAAVEAARLSGTEGVQIRSASALRALSRRELERPALLFLAAQTDAELLGELALTADGETLADCLASVRARLAQSPGGTIDVDRLGWILEASSWAWLAGLAREAEQGAALPPELSGLLLRLAGEAGRYPDLLLDAQAESAGAGALRVRIERENLIFLEDSDPAARVRAYDWLAVRGLAPEGFDPLASANERRAVLARLEQAALDEAPPGAEDGR